MAVPRRGAAVAAAVSIGLAVATPAQAVIGGSAAEAAAYPWLAAIGTPAFPFRPGGHFCAGVLVAPDRVLTAGHCAVLARPAPETLTITFGRTDVAGDGGITARVEAIHLHPDFRVSTFDGDLAFHHDIAVLTLTEPVALPTVDIGAPQGDSATVVGWGATAEDDWSNSRLRTATIPLRSDDDCATAYGSDFDPAQAVCAGSPTADTAQFDSGGPLLIGGKVVALTSWAKGSAEPGYPGVYARVPALDF
ncbi:serine protease [Nocardia transvalensis]|uniref:serine protease n=1 Tax=Nocardia transvalensis TaxID=37333 RepID=UPI001892FF66|nr:serine protease [Nocardia transvalensis]MBF6331237.1 serine protease [Nocardia transvalensis]